MPVVDIAAIQATVVSCTFAVCLLLGAIMQRSNFCTMGALADIVNMGDWTRMRMWLCAIGVAIAGTQLLAWSGLIDLGKSVYTAPALTWLSYLIPFALISTPKLFSLSQMLLAFEGQYGTNYPSLTAAAMMTLRSSCEPGILPDKSNSTVQCSIPGCSDHEYVVPWC